MSEIQDVDEETRNISTEKVQVDTEVSSKSLFYTWTVSNFSECMKIPSSRILSPEFEFAGEKWRLWLQVICKNGKLDKVKIRLIKTEKCCSGYYIKYKFSLLNTDGSLISKESSLLFHAGSLLGHRLMFKYNEKKKSASASPFIINDKLTVNCELLVLSLETGQDQISSNDTVNQSDKELHKHANNYLSKGLIQSRSNSQELKKANVPKRSPAQSFSRAMSNAENLRNRKRKSLIEFMILLLLTHTIAFYTFEVCQKESSINKKLLLNVNMTEVNDLIVDSTLKIRVIAEALNLTEIKIKSSELLAWYDENYNISVRNFPHSEEKISPFVISEEIIVNVSSTVDKKDVNNAEKGVDNEH